MSAPSRPSFDEYFMGIAEAVSKRADCTRRAVGAILVDKHRRLISSGYNGSPPGGPSCLAGECPRGTHFLPFDSPGFCACGKEWPCIMSVDPGSSYDSGPGVCEANHAEGNALLWADPQRVDGSSMYVTAEPCPGCWRLIKGMRIACVFYPGPYGMESVVFPPA